MAQPGSKIGSWRLVRQLGEGPFGVVWLAEDQEGRPVALKLLREAFVQRPAGQTAFSRLLASIRIHQAFHHDTLVDVFGVVQHPEVKAFGMSMQYLEGRLMSSVQLPPAAREGKDARTLGVLLGWFEELGLALGWLHGQGIIHGNLKPTNVMLVKSPGGHQPKVLDTAWSAIGLAPPAAGMASFLAPEQLNGATPTAASDQWSMATMLSQILVGGPRPLTLGSLPAVLVLAVQRATQENPALRFPRIDDLVGALHAIRNELLRAEPVSSVHPERLTPRLGTSSPQGFNDDVDTVRQPKPKAISSPRPNPLPVASTDPGPMALMPRSVAFSESGGALPVHRDPVPVPHAREIDVSKQTSDDIVDGQAGPSAGTFHPPIDAGPSFGLDQIEIADSGPSLGPTTGSIDRSSDIAPSRGPTTRTRKAARRRPLLIYGGILMVIALGIVLATGTLTDFGSSNAAVVPPPPPPIAAPPPPVEPEPPKHVVAPPPPAKASDPIVTPPPPPPGKANEKNRDPKGPDSKSPDLDAKADEAFAKLAHLGDPTPPPPPPTEENLGLKDFTVACDEGDSDACLRIAAMALKKSDQSAARSAFERACDFGRGAGCLDAGDLWAKDNNPASDGRAKKLYARACDQSIAAACHQLAEWYKAGRGGLDDAHKATELEARACQLGRKASCASGPIEKLDDDPPPKKVNTSSTG